MSDCLFCKIIAGDIPAEKIVETENVLAFRDIYPMAREHYLFIHKQHTQNINEMTLKHPEQLSEIFLEIQKFTSSNKLENDGFRIVSNINENGGQSVFHTHFHLLGGEKLANFGR